MPASFDPALVRGLRRVEYDKLGELGSFDHERVELLYGTIVTKSARCTSHESVSQRLTRFFVRAFEGRASVRVGAPLAASDGSEPEPDFAIVALGDYEDEHPTSAHLVVEVAQSSLALDRTTKARLYAECGIPDYWIVNLVDDLVEVHSDIVNDRYARIAPYRRGDVVRSIAFPDVAIAVDDVLPRAR